MLKADFIVDFSLVDLFGRSSGCSSQHFGSEWPFFPQCEHSSFVEDFFADFSFLTDFDPTWPDLPFWDFDINAIPGLAFESTAVFLYSSSKRLIIDVGVSCS
jgi:hypothetical protein